MQAEIVLRAVTPDDEAFLLNLYATTRPEVAQLGWGDAEQQAFIAMQFQMQTRSYAMQCPNAEQSILTKNGETVGRVIVDRTPTAVSLIDIAVLPEFRGQGIATAVLELLQEEVVSADRDVLLTVERMNVTAFNLYRKLGFEIAGEDQIYFSMKWSPTKSKQ
jgi:ribosomal protein S18 acetylase RimI-like enzyme